MANTHFTPTLEHVLNFADELNIPRPTAHRSEFDTWFSALHDIAHHATKPMWYREYATLLQSADHGQNCFCAPPVPDLYLAADPTPNEEHARFWAIKVCEVMGWTNPVMANVKMFGEGRYNPRQWTCANPMLLAHNLVRLGIDIEAGKFCHKATSFELPRPHATTFNEILWNHDAIYRHYRSEMRTDRYDEVHLHFLFDLSVRLNERQFEEVAA